MNLSEWRRGFDLTFTGIKIDFVLSIKWSLSKIDVICSKIVFEFVYYLVVVKRGAELN